MGCVYLRRGKLARLGAGHPWIYANEVARTAESPTDGDIVDIRDHKSRFLGRGYYNSCSQILVRRLTREHEEINEDFFRRRLEAAAALRQTQNQKLPPTARLASGGKTQNCRLVYSEADFLPGLIVDQYGPALVLQILTLGIEKHKGMLVEILREQFHPDVILERSDVVTRKLEGLQPTKGILWQNQKSKIPMGTLSHGTHVPNLKSIESWPVEVEINGLNFSVDLLTGQKTGFFLDQKENYQAVAHLVSLACSERESFRVLDCFTYHGGFALHAAKAGATQVLGVEMSEEALGVARRNAELNHLVDRCEWVCANVFDFLSAASRSGRSGKGVEKEMEPFDLIILDPPSFTRTRESVGSALRGYKEIHLRALKLLKAGGHLVTFCCSHHVDAELFRSVVVEAAADAKQDLRLIRVLTQASDHPILPAIPETEYLKGFILQVV